MNIALVTGAGGLIGSETVTFFAGRGYTVAGVDNDMRKVFFGESASTSWNVDRLKNRYPAYRHHAEDIRNESAMEKIFSEYGADITVIVHTAAQPSHDWAARRPLVDFTVNADGTLLLLEMTRRYCPEAVFIFTSTNKVYGDTPNLLPLVELDTRWELFPPHPYAEKGIDEGMSIDACLHSLFGVSKAAADLLVQEYGLYFGLKTAAFRGGCLTGPNHSGAPLHGFLAYLMKCTLTGEPYTIYGYNGKQVRDNIHCFDLVNMFWHFLQNPRCGEVYNVGGSRHANCSMQEAVSVCEAVVGRRLNRNYAKANRIGDHIWWISDVSKFRAHYPDWDYTYRLEDIYRELYEGLSGRV
jgi:CDP-paratose 2-epimerase